uniref:MtrAB system histidine kinase MtrB n=1 Tax=Kribbia dieselivorans TaxID=331526 RepID=UPI000839664F
MSSWWRRLAADPFGPLRRLPSGLDAAWRRSLQFRVVTTTLILGLLVVSGVSGLMYREVARGLQEDRVTEALQQTQVLADRAQADLDQLQTEDPRAQLSLQVADVIKSLEPGPSDAQRFVVVMASRDNRNTVRIDSYATRGFPAATVPEALRNAVADDPRRQQSTLVEVPADLVSSPSGANWWRLQRPTVAGVMVGQQLSVPIAGQYDLYVTYPMDREQQMLGVVTRSYLLGAIMLVLLVSAVAWVVARQVVAPVRRTAQVAERISSGELNERMAARGTDDIALLGKSFNEMADNLQTQIRTLENVSRVQQRFVSDVSHELRTPLTTIRMAADLIHAQREEFPEGTQRAAELLNDELDRFEALLADLLEISRFDAGAASLESDLVDITAIATRVVEATESIAQARETAVTVHRPDEPATARVDARRIERVLRNLVVNAIEHSEGRGVDVMIGVNTEAVAVVVRDFGVGLKPGEATLAFNRFWRADPARNRTTGGTGLGLAISLEDARLHHGWLQAWGEPGAGARFRLT